VRQWHGNRPDCRQASNGPEVDLEWSNLRLIEKRDLRSVLCKAFPIHEHAMPAPRINRLVVPVPDAGFLKPIKTAFERRIGNWACDPQAHMLRYFLRVAPAYGAKEVAASLQARKSHGCYRLLLQELGDELPRADRIAIKALNDPDPEVEEDAALALRHWGPPDAEPALWAA
jgi:hypothetical protein